MAANHSIAPFPADIDRNAFGHWLSGFTDGEGYFGLCWHRVKGRHGTIRNVAGTSFNLALRQDELPILKMIQSYWQCGSLASGFYPRANLKVSPQCGLRVSSVNDLEKVVVPHFIAYPLRAKKRQDFDLWRQVVLFLDRKKREPRHSRGQLGMIAKWTTADKEWFESCRLSLQRLRVYDAQTGVGIVPTPAEDPTLFD